MINKALHRLGFIICICFTCCMTENRVQAQSSGKNWGIRFGLNAVSITGYEALQSDEILTNSSYVNRNGYLLTVFKRFNINRMFLQPEIAWNNYRRIYSFSLPVDDINSYYQSVDLSIYSKAINANFLVGYNIISDYPFLFGVFAGTSFISTYRTDFSTNPMESITKTDLSMDYSGILGFSINLNKIYFDLRYEMCLPTKLYLEKIPDFQENYQNVMLKKTNLILSFSVGVMF